MSDPTFILGQPGLLVPVILGCALFALVVIRSYWRTRQLSGAARALCALLKIAGFVILAFCLLEPLIRGTRPTPGENVFLILADRSGSLNIKDLDESRSRGERMLEWLIKEPEWMVRLEQDFSVRKYWIGSRLENVDDFEATEFTAGESRLKTALMTLKKRMENRPVAGVLFFTDGNATDSQLTALDESALPPVFPVMVGADTDLPDLEIERVDVSQTNFEAAPVRITARIRSQNSGNRPVVVELLDEQKALIDRQMVQLQGETQVTFKVKPDTAGIRFYTIEASFEEDFERIEKGQPRLEGTLDNNSKSVVVDRGNGPFRVLYVSGRPNWEFKFLNRALAEDQEVKLVGLIRIARKKPKFDFRRKGESTTSEFFKGFETDEDETEQYFEPVLIRIGTEDEHELRGGFPRTAADLFRYDAIICDDVEAGYFSSEQMSLIQRFVSERGGGFLMLGGQESFQEGKYSRTPIADLLPVYVNRSSLESGPDGPTIQPSKKEAYRLRLSRTGFLQPWIRLRGTEDDEAKRLGKMPAFASLNRTDGIKPGADELAFAIDSNGESHSALVTQNYGKGRSGALLIGDYWRWGMNRRDPAANDLATAWRQTVRWLVADVPGRIEVSVDQSESVLSDYRIQVRVRNEEFQPLDNAELKMSVTRPDGTRVLVRCQPSDHEAGVYLAEFPALKGGEGNYLVEVVCLNPDGTLIGSRQAGWVYSPASQELGDLAPNETWLRQLAERSGGEMLNPADLDDFVKQLPNRRLPRKETSIFPLWHHMLFFWIAIVCFAAEWGIRRIRGLP